MAEIEGLILLLCVEVLEIKSSPVMLLLYVLRHYRTLVDNITGLGVCISMRTASHSIYTSSVDLLALGTYIFLRFIHR